MLDTQTLEMTEISDAVLVTSVQEQDSETESERRYGSTGVILPCEKKGEYYINSVEIKKKPVYMFFKRLFDILFSAIALIVLAIPMLFIAIAVKISSPGPVIYRQERLGLNGKKFNILKFRTMYIDAEKNGAQWSEGSNDPRITSVGAVLRKFRGDELLQFWLCLKGTMSLVGPRPERECFYAEFETYIHGFHERLKVKPGITGLAQINGGYDLKPEQKIKWDVEYIMHRSLWLDIKILFGTVKEVLTGDGAK